MGTFARRPSIFRGGPRWIPGAVAVVMAVLVIMIKRSAAQRTSATPEFNTTINCDYPKGGDHDDQAGDHESDEEAVCEDSAESAVQSQDKQSDEQSDLLEENEEGYIVVTAAEIGPAIERACFTPAFIASSAEVRRTWGLVGDEYIQRAGGRVYEVLQTKDHEAASLFVGKLLDSREGECFADTVGKVIGMSTEPVLLMQTLRPLGEHFFAKKVQESQVYSLSEAMVQAVGEGLQGKESLLPSTVAAWDDFLTTIWACTLLAGALGDNTRRDLPETIDLSGSEQESLTSKYWKRQDGQLNCCVPTRERAISPSNEKVEILQEFAAVEYLE